MCRKLVIVALLGLVGGSPALGRKRSSAGGPGPSARAVSELGGKFKWGQSPEQVIKIIGDEIHARYADSIAKETDVYQQDQLRADERAEIEKIRSSYLKFDGQKSGWDVSLVDHEFAHKNGESMLVRWEKDQRRFLFFFHDKLYKQYIAFNAEHPVFAGKRFDDFVKILQNRYGAAEMKFTKLRTKDDMTLDHLEWPPSGDYLLRAIDQSPFYGNFCVALIQRSMVAQVEKGRELNSPRPARGNALVEAVTGPETIKGDANADVVDQIVGRKEGAGTQVPASPPTKKKAGGKTKSGDPLQGVKY